MLSEDIPVHRLSVRRAEENRGTFPPASQSKTKANYRLILRRLKNLSAINSDPDSKITDDGSGTAAM